MIKRPIPLLSVFDKIEERKEMIKRVFIIIFLKGLLLQYFYKKS